MKRKIRLILLMLCLFVLCSGTAQAMTMQEMLKNCYSIQASPQKYNPKILMVGNSHTSYNGLPDMLQKICHNQGINAEVTALTLGGHSIYTYLYPSTEKDMIFAEKLDYLLDNEVWDYIILQERRGESFDHLEPLMEAISEIQRKVEENDTQLVFFSVYESRHPSCAPASQPLQGAYQMPQMAKASYKIAQELALALAPCGIAFERSKALYPELVLYRNDDVHPSVAGSYLTACTLYGTMFGNDPRRITFCGNLKKDVAKKMQSVAAGLTTNRTSIQYYPKTKTQEIILQAGSKITMPKKVAGVTLKTWRSSNASKVSVNKNGVIKSKRTSGPVSISAKSGTNKSIVWKVYVLSRPFTMYAGKSRYISELLPASITWKSKNPRILTVKGDKLNPHRRGIAKLVGKDSHKKRYVITIKVR